MSYFQTYNKKRFFKSRNKTATNAPEPQPPLKLASDFTEKEPPRVPPVSEHFVQIAAVGDSKSSSAADKSASNQVSKILASGMSPYKLQVPQSHLLHIFLLPTVV